MAFAAGALHVTPVVAQPPPVELMLPLLGALAVGRSAMYLHAEQEGNGSVRSLLPKPLRIPDGYEIDLERDPPRFAEPVDRDKVVGLSLLPRPIRNTTVELSYDEESAPIGEGSDLFRIVIEWHF